MKARLAALLLCVCGQGAVAAQSLEDFAFAVPIEGTNSDALYRVVLPPAVYEGSAFADLKDLRVFNGAGEVVPYALRPAAPATREREPVALPVFALRAAAGAAPEDLDISLDASEGRTRLRVKSRANREAQTVVVGYLIDLSAHKETFSGLVLDWEAEPAGYVSAVKVEASDDLRRWTPLVADAPLVSLARDGQRLEQKTIPFAAQRAKYLRLTWPRGSQVVRLKSASGLPAEEATPPARQWKEISALPDPRSRGDYPMDLGGPFPVDRLVIRLPQDNSVAPLQILARARPADEWVPVARTVAYRLRQGGRQIVNPELAVSASARRYWLLRTDSNSGGVGDGALQVRVGWVAGEIVFAARGAGPFRLAFGHGRAQPNALPIQTLVPGWGSESAPQIALATTGGVQTLAGEAAARSRIDPKKASLWAALLAGVALLGFMAWRLSKQLRAERE